MFNFGNAAGCCPDMEVSGSSSPSLHLTTKKGTTEQAKGNYCSVRAECEDSQMTFSRAVLSGLEIQDENGL